MELNVKKNLICISDLKSVDADKVYVLGGLVDESIQKVLLHSCCELLLIFKCN